MRAGLMRQRVTIQKKAPVARDAFGAETPAWTGVATVWAQVETLTGREFVQQGQAGAQVSHKVTIRHRSDVTPAMRVTWDSRTLQIEAVLRESTPRGLLLMCSEQVS